jgi:uncharacterized protein (TIGR00730 family)
VKQAGVGCRESPPEIGARTLIGVLAGMPLWNILGRPYSGTPFWEFFMKSICVYCGSANLASREYFSVASRMGKTLARRGLTLVYGGGKTGLMGAVADGALENGGQVIGVITEGMNTPELAHTRLTRLEVMATIHQRKQRMYDLADGYIALPGGYGTLDELFETLTWAQIGEHSKPVGLLNALGYYDPLLMMLDRAQQDKFLFPEHRQLLICNADPEALLEAMEAFQPPLEAVQRWMRQDPRDAD